MVLAAVLDGCPEPLLAPHLAQIADALVEPDVCQEYQQVSKQSDSDFAACATSVRPAPGVNPLWLRRSSPASSEASPVKHLKTFKVYLDDCSCQVLRLPEPDPLLRPFKFAVDYTFFFLSAPDLCAPAVFLPRPRYVMLAVS